MRTILIGKEGNQPFSITEPTVSRKHANLIIYDDGSMVVRDNNSANGTFVKLRDGSYRRIHECKVVKGMVLRLGPTFEVSVNNKLLDTRNVTTEDSMKRVTSSGNQTPQEIDITALRYLSDHYNKQKLSLDQQNSTNGLLRMIIPMLTAAGAMLGLLITPSDGTDDEMTSIMYKVIPSLVVIFCGALLFYYINKQSKKIITKRNELDLSFRRNYCCPNCHYSFGSQIYENILLSGNCPKCKGTFVEKV